MSKRDGKGDVASMAEVRELHDDNGDEYASNRVWSALALAIHTIDKMLPAVMALAKQSCVCSINYQCLRCEAKQLLTEID
jgi:hypothetical protein